VSVAKPLPHDAAARHVDGTARYVDDIPVPAGTLHLCFGTSTVARGRVTAMDLAPVRAAPGVVAVLTAEDLPLPADVSPSAHDEPLLSDGTVHYAGQPLFLVVAESHLQARKAARRAQVSYAEETPILTVDEALAAGSRFEEGPRVYGRGDVEAALATAPQVAEGEIEIGGQEHFYLEGQAALALPQEGGDMIVHASSQHPTEIQHKVADALGLPMHAVRVEVRRMGGGFGGKESQGNALAVACAVAARAPRAGPARCATTGTTISSSPASATPSSSAIAPATTPRGGFWPWSSGNTPSAAGRRTCRCRWPTARCCTPTTPTGCPTCGSRATG